MKTTSPWTRLLSAARGPVAAGAGAPESAARSPFQRDHDRILFSGPFRRLADKTQVFPLPVDDHVHSRLTHSLEVASIGRSLGSLVGAGLAAAGETDAAPRELGDCVAAACLAHDLGNPPFGHVGEQAIREYFAAHPDALAGLAERERLDLLRYEGNAQAFRIVTRLERPWRGGGLGLTHATLGAFVKYPCASDAAGGPGAGRSARKHGLMAADVPVWAGIADALGLARAAGADRWRRHPLAFLAEAADDVAYLLLDLEDGLRLGHVDERAYAELVRPLAGADAAPGSPLPREQRLDRAAHLRARAVDTLLRELTAAFLARREAILDGGFDGALRAAIPHAAALAAIEETCVRRCYEARDVLKLELTGAEAIHGLLELLCGALAEPGTLRARHLRRLWPAVLAPEGGRYDQLVRITDHIAGMTDHYAVRVYRELRGMRYPGGRD